MSEYIFKLPDLGEGTVESEIAEWHVAVGDQVSEEDIIGTMMTDKAAVELSSPVSGRVVSLAGDPGDVVAVGAPLVVFETDGTAVADTPVERESRETTTAARATEAPPTAEESPAPRKNRVATSPVVRRLAQEAGVDLREVTGSGPGGRIKRSDLEEFLEQRGNGAAKKTPREPKVTEIKVIGVRRMIAERMSTAKREIPHFSYVEEVDITKLEALRQHLIGKKEEKVTLLPFIGLALVRALQEFPQCNATYDKDRNVILRHGAVHLGIATQTPDGLKVPVVRNCESRSLGNLAAEIRRVSEAARNNSIKRDELTGSTITITSLGRLGGIVTTPVINLPEVAIIGINRAVERPVVVDGQITIRTMMNLSSSFDHRFVDGYDAAAMIQSIKDMLEHPATIFLT
ncbi:MAG: 2-oxo acid dehydrogenase subunit E2 [Gammaproteobacteria bacterium]|nr:2-oxo acid dehydrogenase subunit E2 [Gammaproteobacteria bacterium]